jgi:hypothetical protein
LLFRRFTQIQLPPPDGVSNERRERRVDRPPISGPCLQSVLPLARLGSGNDHIGIAADAFGADQPIPSFEEGHCSAVAFGLFGGIGLDLMAAIAAPYDPQWARLVAIGWSRVAARVSRSKSLHGGRRPCEEPAGPPVPIPPDIGFAADWGSSRRVLPL